MWRLGNEWPLTLRRWALFWGVTIRMRWWAVLAAAFVGEGLLVEGTLVVDSAASIYGDSFFGSALAPITPTLVAVGAPGADNNVGAVYLLTLDGVAGTSHLDEGGAADMPTTIGSGELTLREYGWFGYALALLPDLDGDGQTTHLVVGAPSHDYSTSDTGAVYVLTLNASFAVISSVDLATLFSPSTPLAYGHMFGRGLTTLGDLDGDGMPELAVCHGSMTAQQQAVFILFLTSTGEVKQHVRIDGASGGFDAQPSRFAMAALAFPDVDGDGVGELAVSGARMGLPSRYSLRALYRVQPYEGLPREGHCFPRRLARAGYPRLHQIEARG